MVGTNGSIGTNNPKLRTTFESKQDFDGYLRKVNQSNADLDKQDINLFRDLLGGNNSVKIGKEDYLLIFDGGKRTFKGQNNTREIVLSSGNLKDIEIQDNDMAFISGDGDTVLKDNGDKTYVHAENIHKIEFKGNNKTLIATNLEHLYYNGNDSNIKLDGLKRGLLEGNSNNHNIQSSEDVIISGDENYNILNNNFEVDIRGTKNKTKAAHVDFLTFKGKDGIANITTDFKELFLHGKNHQLKITNDAKGLLVDCGSNNSIIRGLD